MRTELPICPITPKVTHQGGVITMGSCFSDEIGQRLHSAKFNTLVNPFGTIFNPISINNLILTSLGENEIDKNFITDREGLKLHHHYHSSFVDSSVEGLLELLYNQHGNFNEQLKKTSHLIITFGTSIVYSIDDQIVANCHKVPQKQFSKRMLNVNEIVEHCETTFNTLFSRHPNIQVVLTLSPVRHTKDSLITNSASKATLRIAIEQLVTNHSRISYYPSYEIAMDDLRDYRFYKSDLIHLNDQGLHYIWEHFINSSMEESTIAIINDWKKIQNGLNHKPFNPASEGYMKFLTQLEKALMNIQTKLNVDQEINQVQILRKQYENGL